MTLIPQRTVAGQVAAQLEQDIRGGVWQGWLPNERELSQRLHVSRSSLRAALEHLRRIGVTEPVHGIGHRIVTTATGPVRSNRSVGLITPERVVPFARIGQADACICCRVFMRVGQWPRWRGRRGGRGRGGASLGTRSSSLLLTRISG